MTRLDTRGFTLIELLLASGILALIGAAAVGLITTGLNAHSQGSTRFELYQEGTMAMQRITDGVRRCTFLQIPNAHAPVRNILAFSGFDNTDDDYYFDDPLFPRIDEDPRSDMNWDGKNGIAGFDDDGDGTTDEVTHAYPANDDEDTESNEDPLDGVDNDGDGNIDEDVQHDANADGFPGIAGMDDNGDGQVDNGFDTTDDDEDGQRDEDLLGETVYWIPSGTTLREDHQYSGENRTLSEYATAFQVTYESPERILIELTLTGKDGESVTLSEYVCPRNRLQKLGKRVR